MNGSIRPGRVIRRDLPLVGSNTYRLTFELPNLELVNPRNRFLPLVRVVDLQDYYEYVRDGGKAMEIPRDDQAYSPSPLTNSVKQLTVMKPLRGEWSFRVRRRIKRALFLPFLYMPLGGKEEIWDSAVFTNQNRPPDVNSVTVNGPFE